MGVVGFKGCINRGVGKIGYMFGILDELILRTSIVLLLILLSLLLVRLL